ncbi:interferon-induced protein 44-like [Centropristis striata]|uniref:interferon-induced protein 44-like n=1 Tax=Centropristis striata TaxID=184440 RepID=UPI0027E19572|nr:interferon-induced protein 44-like [Centropristis striata]
MSNRARRGPTASPTQMNTPNRRVPDVVRALLTVPDARPPGRCVPGFRALALFSQPWRALPEGKQEDLTFVKNYQPPNQRANHLRILLYGPAGAGKSSFINSVDSILQGRNTGRAPTDATSKNSFTQNYKTYKIHKGPDDFYSFVFNDTMGFENNANTGVLVGDIKLALEGHVEDGYKFSPSQELMEGDKGYRSAPTLDHKVHVLVCVLPADKVSLIKEDKFVEKMREVRLAACHMGIPQLAILTNVDEACPKTNRNIRHAYKSQYLKQQVDTLSLLLGLPQSSIFLVKNYGPAGNMNDDNDVLILSALRQIITSGEDFLNDL